MNTYKVLKDWGDFKAGETFVPSEHTDIAPGDIANLLAEGVLEVIEADSEPIVDYIVTADDGAPFADGVVVKGVMFGATASNPEIVQFLAEGKIAVATDADKADKQSELEKDIADQQAKEEADAAAKVEADAAAKVEADAAAAGAEGGIIANDAAAEKRFNGQVVIVDGSRTIEDKEYHHIRIEDGTEYDLTDAEYAEQVA